MSQEELSALQTVFTPVHFSAEIVSYFEESWEKVAYDKHEFLTEAGRTERYFYYVLEGVQGLYLINKEGQKVFLAFSYRTNFSGDLESLIRNEPSNYFIEALTQTSVLRMSRENYLGMFDKFPEFDRWGRILLERILIGRGKREVELLIKNAEERYRAFITRCPPELLNIPQKYLASYLNMTPETFSRLRSTVIY